MELFSSRGVSGSYIPLNGSGTTTAPIPFEEGISIAPNKWIYFNGPNSSPSMRYFSSTDTFLIGSNGNVSLSCGEEKYINIATGTTGIILNDLTGVITINPAPTFSSLTGPSLLQIDSSEKVGVVSVGSSLNYTSGSLNTIQDITTGASPMFSSITLNSITLGASGVMYDDGGDWGIEPTSKFYIGTGAFECSSGVLATFRGGITITHATTAGILLESSAGDDYTIRNSSGALQIVNSTDGFTDISISNTGSINIGRDSATITIAKAANLVFDTSSGNKLGTATTQKFAFWNATPTTQIAGSTDILAGLVTVGLRAATSNPPLNMGTGALTCGNIACRQITITDGQNIVCGSTSGNKVGTATTQKIGFWNAAPVVRPSAYTQTYSTADKTLGAYTADDESAAYTGIDNAQAGTVYATVANLNALRTAYENLRLFCEDAVKMLNSVVDDGQAIGIWG